MTLSSPIMLWLRPHETNLVADRLAPVAAYVRAQYMFPLILL